MLTIAASIGRPPTSFVSAPACEARGRSASPGAMPQYGPVTPFAIAAPEHARWTNVTDVLSSRCSSASAASASNDRAERSQRGSCQRGPPSAAPTSGFPSPLATESPSPTTRKSRASTVAAYAGNAAAGGSARTA